MIWRPCECLPPHVALPLCTISRYAILTLCMSRFWISSFIVIFASNVCYYYSFSFSTLPFFFFNDTATSLISTLPLHDSLLFFLNDPAPPEISPFPLHGPLPI